MIGVPCIFVPVDETLQRIPARVGVGDDALPAMQIRRGVASVGVFRSFPCTYAIVVAG